MIEEGAYVKIVFRNGTQVEGYVEEWEENTTTLISEDQLSRFVVLDIKQDVLGIKICYGEVTPKQVQRKFEEVVEEFKAVQESPNDDLRLETLADLKILMNKQEKKIIMDRVRSHDVSEVRIPQYGIPSFLQVKRPQ